MSLSQLDSKLSCYGLTVMNYLVLLETSVKQKPPEILKKESGVIILTFVFEMQGPVAILHLDPHKLHYFLPLIPEGKYMLR